VQSIGVYFCPAAELQCAVAATELSIIWLLEQQSACFVKLLPRQLNGARARLHPRNSGASSIIFIVIWVSDQRTTTPSGTWGYFPVVTEVQWNSRMIFFRGRVLPVLAGWLFSEYWQVPRDPHMSSSEAAINHVWLWKSNRHKKQTTHTHTHTHTLCAHTYSMCTESQLCIDTHTHISTHLDICMSTCSLFLVPYMNALRYTTSRGVIGKELLSGSVAAKHKLLRRHRLLLPLLSFRWHAMKGWAKKKKKKGVKQITLEEPSGARKHIYLNWCRSLSVVFPSLMRKFTYSFTLVSCQRKTNDAFAAIKIIISKSFSQTIHPLSPGVLMNTPDFKDRLDMERSVLFQLHTHLSWVQRNVGSLMH